MASQTYALTNALLLDGTGNDPVENATIVISGANIVAAGAGIPIPEDAEIIDVAGKTIMPGLIDAHIHLGGMGFKSVPPFAGSEATDNYSLPRHSALRYGVTTQRSLGDFLTDSLALRDDIESGAVLGPRLVASGPSFQVEGGHPNGSVWFNDADALREAARVPKSPEEAKQDVDALAEAGVDLVKIIISNNGIFGPPQPELKLPWAVTEAIIDSAHAKGLRVAAHAETCEDALAAVQRGVDDIEHLVMRIEGAFDEEAFDELFELMAARGTYLVPTMVAHQRDIAPETDGSTIISGSPMVRRAFDRGVKIGVGSDAHSPGMHGWRLHKEMAMMVHEQGLPTADVIVAATQTNAELLGISDRVGTLEAGKVADLLILNGNPLDDISALSNIHRVILSGAVLSDIDQ